MALLSNYRLFLLALFSPLLVSCSNVVEQNQPDEYPPSWSNPLVASGKECSSRKGIFSNYGKSSNEGANYPITLDGAIFNTSPIRGTAEKVLLDYIAGGSELRVQLFSGSIGDARPFSTFSRSVNCENGWLVMDQSGTGYVDGTYSESANTIFMAISESGELIVHSVFHVNSRSLGVFRSNRKSDVWYLFSQTES